MVSSLAEHHGCKSLTGGRVHVCCCLDAAGVPCRIPLPRQATSCGPLKKSGERSCAALRCVSFSLRPAPQRPRHPACHFPHPIFEFPLRYASHTSHRCVGNRLCPGSLWRWRAHALAARRDSRCGASFSLIDFCDRMGSGLSWHLRQSRSIDPFMHKSSELGPPTWGRNMRSWPFLVTCVRAVVQSSRLVLAVVVFWMLDWPTQFLIHCT